MNYITNEKEGMNVKMKTITVKSYALRPSHVHSLYNELTKCILFEFENDGMEPLKRHSLISLLFIINCLGKN